MTTTNRARSIRPTDLVALVSFDGEVYPNEAQSWSRVAAGSGGLRPLENAFEQWFSFATGRYSWISVKGRNIRGMLSARRRSGGLAWEVDCLVLTEDDVSLLGALVEQMVSAAARVGTRRVFLRLREDSPLVSLVRAAGFFASRREHLFASDAPRLSNVGDPPVRPRRKGDLLELFSLYNAAVPQPIRALEAVTLQEWQAFRDTRGFGHREEEFVLEEAGRITASLRVARSRSAGWLELTSGNGHRWLDALLACGLRSLGNKRQLFVVTPEHAGGQVPLLREAGFADAGTFLTFVKRIAVPVAEAETSPLASPAVAV